MPFRKKGVKGNGESREKAVRQYAEIRIKASEEEKKELDEVEAGYDFSVSTGIILLTIAGFYMIYFQIVFYWINISLIVLSIIFFIGATLNGTTDIHL